MELGVGISDVYLFLIKFLNVMGFGYWMGCYL